MKVSQFFHYGCSVDTKNYPVAVHARGALLWRKYIQYMYNTFEHTIQENELMINLFEISRPPAEDCGSTC